ncbi:MAG: hypothetical protein QOH49_977 [Acidobacteriota bacterium]|jgi:hypothetical protein|nr:hypothetical protein [Acidobacteriota bacterium]
MTDKADNKLHSPEQVALELMHHIANIEAQGAKTGFEEPDLRTYYLTLFHQCIMATRPDYDISDIVKR